MSFLTRSELRWSRQVSFSNAICYVDYRELERYLTITRCYAINGEIERECPGSMCHSPGLAQRNLPSQHENDIRGLSDRILMKCIVADFIK